MMPKLNNPNIACGLCDELYSSPLAYDIGTDRRREFALFGPALLGCPEGNCFSWPDGCLAEHIVLENVCLSVQSEIRVSVTIKRAIAARGDLL